MERVRKEEYELALQRISKGEDVAHVMETMARRIMDKGLHSLTGKVKEFYRQTPSDLNQIQGHVPKNVADQIEENNFDNPE